MPADDHATTVPDAWFDSESRACELHVGLAFMCKSQASPGLFQKRAEMGKNVMFQSRRVVFTVW